MRNIDWLNIEASGEGSFDRLEPGAYVGTITAMTDEESKQYVRMLFDIAEGKHKLFFRVWDIQNNSSSAELEFEVDPDYAPELYDVYVYPNPVVNDANFVCVHDRPQTPVNVTVSVYDLAGRMLWTSGKTLLTDSSNRTTVTWNIRSDGGLNAVDGIYLARVVFEDSDGLKSARTVKLIVRAQ